VHIGIGTNVTVGGKVRAAIHYDLIVTKATVIADGRTVLKDGEVCVK
jgi:leucyl aminopeptidase (aminopeptidase T)